MLQLHAEFLQLWGIGVIIFVTIHLVGKFLLNLTCNLKLKNDVSHFVQCHIFY